MGRSKAAGRAASKASPSREFILTDQPLVDDQELWRQFRRIGGNLTPQDVSNIILEADTGNICRFVDLANEARQKDGHLHSVLQTRELAVKGLEWDLKAPRDASDEEKKATAEMKAVLEDSENFPDLLHHLTGAGVFHGHSTAETMYRLDAIGGKPFLVPFKWRRIHPNRFAFSPKNGQLLFTQDNVNGIDLLSEFPGKFVQYQPIVNGDAAAREGLARILVWQALFRNWDLRDWLQYGEVGWKPWRIGTYEKDGVNQKDIEALRRALKNLGTTGSALLPSTVKMDVEWPKGVGNTITSSHKELFDQMGTEMSKTVLGQTLTTEQGNRGSQALGNVQDRVRGDILVADAVSEAAVITRQVIRPFYALNYSDRLRPARFIFRTEESVDLLMFSKAMNELKKAGLRIPAEWVRSQGGIPNPKEGEEVLENGSDEPDNEPSNQDGDGNEA